MAESLSSEEDSRKISVDMVSLWSKIIRKRQSRAALESDGPSGLDSELQQIRFLKLHPASDPVAPVSCSLETVSLLSNPKPAYETVSYVWGAAAKREQLTVNGLRINAPASAVRVLRQFRHESTIRVVWIDAICINQANIAERNQQVALMADIYSSCDRALVWLGEDDGFAALASTAIDAILDDAESATNGMQNFMELAPQRGISDHAVRELNGRVSIVSFYRLCSLPWFGRLWGEYPSALSPSYDSGWHHDCTQHAHERGSALGQEVVSYLIRLQHKPSQRWLC
jgi:hypothetical protein